MKTLRQTCAVAVLTLLLSVSLFAGQVNCPGKTDPPLLTETTITSDITTSVIVTIVGLIN